MINCSLSYLPEERPPADKKLKNTTFPYFSIILPILNEAGNLEQLFGEIELAMTRIGKPYEVICINDGSSDDSGTVITKFQVEKEHYLFIDFKDTRGQSTALWAGVEHCSGEYIITMDADLQNDPEDLVMMVSHIPEFDLVTGWRQDRQDSPFKLFCSKIANSVRNRLTGESIKDTGCSLKIMKSSYLKQLLPFNGMHRFLPTLLKMVGAKVIEVPVKHRKRGAGSTKYGITNRLFCSFIDLLAVRWMQNRKITYEIQRKQ